MFKKRRKDIQVTKLGPYTLTVDMVKLERMIKKFGFKKVGDDILTGVKADLIFNDTIINAKKHDKIRRNKR
jgi:hypothetical protein